MQDDSSRTTAKLRCVKLVQAVIVRDVDAWPHFRLFTAMQDVHAQARTLHDGLRGDGKQGQDQHRAIRVATHCVSPRDLHAGLAETGVGKDGARPRRLPDVSAI